ncbi:MAG: hypothetical protein VCF24_08940 [Candidatus Latescibacterota bacterium]
MKEVDTAEEQVLTLVRVLGDHGGNQHGLPGDRQRSEKKQPPDRGASGSFDADGQSQPQSRHGSDEKTPGQGEHGRPVVERAIDDGADDEQDGRYDQTSVAVLRHPSPASQGEEVDGRAVEQSLTGLQPLPWQRVHQDSQ